MAPALVHDMIFAPHCSCSRSI